MMHSGKAGLLILLFLSVPAAVANSPPDQPGPDMTAIRIPAPSTVPADAQEFTNALERTVAEKNVQALLNLLTEDVVASFGGMEGRRDFIRYWELNSEPEESSLWPVLESLLTHPPVRQSESLLVWPYFFAEWPPEADAYFYLFADGENLPLRVEPDYQAPVLGRVSHEALRLTDDNCCNPGEWASVRDVSGRRGYVSRKEGWRSIVGYRLVARREDQSWKIRALVAGD